MEKKTITFRADGQILWKTDTSFLFASNIVSYINAEFTLGDNWTGFDAVRAVWKTATDQVSMVLDEEGKCEVPAEVLRYPSRVLVNLVGSNVVDGELQNRLTTYPCHAFTIDQSAHLEGSETPNVTPSLFEQFVSMVKGYWEDIHDYRRDAEAWAVGERNGEPVSEDDDTYHNNSKYYSDRARADVERLEYTILEHVDRWLDRHPEATTTVQDGSLTEPKFSDALKLKAIKDYVTPQMFGAKGDGVTDDSLAINTMFSSVDDKYILFPAGTYLCEQDIRLDTTDNNIVGAGQYKSIIKLGEGVVFSIVSERNTFTDLRFQAGQGVVCDKYHNTFSRCWFQNSEVGIRLNSGYICQFTNCYITHNKLGVLLNNQSYETVFDGCVIDNNVLGVIVANDSSGCVFSNCTIEGNFNRTSGVGCGVFICSANTRVVISKCHLENNGNTQTSVDVFAHSGKTSSATLLTELYNEIETLYDGSFYLPVGIISISDCRFYGTKYGIVTGGSDVKFTISNNYFSGILNRGNKSVLINGASLLANTVVLNNNVVQNTNNSAITTEMLNGIKSSYVYTDIVPTEAQYNSLIDGQIILDNVPLFLYRGRALSLEGTKTYPKIICADGTSHDGGLTNGNLTNYFTGSTKTLYVSPDGTAYNLFAQNGYNEFIALTNNEYARVNTSGGWVAWTKYKDKVYPIKRLTLNNREMLTRNNAIVFMLIELTVNDIKKMQGCIAFEPTDISMYEFR